MSTRPRARLSERSRSIRILRGSAVALVFGIFVISLMSLFFTLLSNDISFDGTLVRVHTPTTPVDASYVNTSQASPSGATVSITVERYLAAEHEIEVNVALACPDSWKAKLVELGPHRSRTKVFSGDAFLSSFVGATFGVTFSDRYSRGASRTAPIVVGKAQPGSYSTFEDFCRSRPATVRLPVWGHAPSYPNDAYGIDAFVWISLPPGLALDNGMGGITLLPDFNLAIAAGPGLAGRELAVTTNRRNDSSNFRTFGVILHRPLFDRIYIMAIAFVPMIFGVALLDRFFLVQSPSSGLTNDSLLGAAAAILAVLPLRAVLVPTEITALTTVDFLLGAGLALIVLTLTAKHAAAAWLPDE
jgi:hypothetical protein